MATRAASGKALNWLAPQVPELIGGSADLAPSTSTNLDDYPSILRHDFGGRNLHFGIREHAMGAIVNAMTIEGLRAYGATFLVFSDYMRGAIRMAAIMEIPSIFVFTHDSIGVGEDGPTHQPIEHLASLRAMPNLEVIRPADVNETFLAWHWLLGAISVPTALMLSRQKLPVLDRDSVPEDAIERGAYVLRDAEGEPDLILIGTGSEVSLCLEAADQLSGDGTAVRVVSMPSTTRFLKQEQAYRDEVLPPAVTSRLSVEAGTTSAGTAGSATAAASGSTTSAPRRRRRHRRALRLHGRSGCRAGPSSDGCEPMRFACGFDHAGVSLREVVFAAVREAGHEPLDLGTDDDQTPDDYPDRALAVARAIRGGDAERGILCCGSGAGVAVAASKVDGIRCAMAHDTYTARQCVEHDDVNVLALGARVIGPEIAPSSSPIRRRGLQRRGAPRPPARQGGRDRARRIRRRALRVLGIGPTGMPLTPSNVERGPRMRRKLGVIATCGALAASLFAPAAGSAGVQERNKAQKCELLLKRYHVALDKGKDARAKKLKKKFEKKGCGEL